MISNIRKFILPMAVAAVAALPQGASAYSIYPEEVTVVIGREAKLPIAFDNGELPFSAFLFDVYTPEGITIQNIPGEVDKDGMPMPAAEYTSRASSTHMYTSKWQPTGAARYLGESTTNAACSGSDGAVMLLPIVVDANLPAGDYTVAVRRANFSYENKNYIEEGTRRFLDVFTEDVETTIHVVEPTVDMDYRFYAEEVTAEVGIPFVYEIKMKNLEDVKGFSFNIELPEGLTLLPNDDFETYEDDNRFDYVEDRMGKKFEVEFDYNESTATINVAGYYHATKVYYTDAGDEVTFMLYMVAEASGEYEVLFTHQSFTTDDAVYNPSDFSALITATQLSFSMSYKTMYVDFNERLHVVCRIDHENIDRLKHYDVWVVKKTPVSARAKAPAEEVEVGRARVVKTDDMGDYTDVDIETSLDRNSTHNVAVRAKATLTDDTELHASSHQDGDAEGAAGMESLALDPTGLVPTGVEAVSADTAPVEYFDMLGRRVDNPSEGIYIRRSGRSVSKVRL